MKKFIVSLIALSGLAAGSIIAGPVETQQQTQQTAYQPAVPDLYRNQEWNFDLFGAYGFTGDSESRFLGTYNHGFGGGFDASYIFARYFGVGVEGYALDTGDRALGEASGDLIFRYPIPNSSIAPYALAGGGAVFNGDRFGHAFVNDAGLFVNERRTDTEGVGQFGGGVEVRITPNFGIMNDITWNVVNGSHNNFGLVRSGLRFSF